jgi:ATP-dependent Clp protease adaptor protein ClpS
MKYHLDTVEVLEDVELELDSISFDAHLVVYNDEVNTFDWVIECFTQILRHTSEQAEQLACIIHYKGKATVKTAAKKILLPFKDALLERGLSAVIEETVA